MQACMATSSVLVYTSGTPNQGLLGYGPRDVYTLENTNLSAVAGATAAKPDFLETSMRAKLLAKDTIIQAVIEHRIAEAASSKHQQYNAETLETLAAGCRCKVDLWREPGDKSMQDWRGPAEVL
jgi:hypothetical protein